MLKTGTSQPKNYKSILAISDWYLKMKRDLPWRGTFDPYSIWISEVMLQQTQVSTVIPYYHRFIADFPTLQTLADAPEDKVLKNWSGLGYYSRARNLQKGARFIQTNYAGVFPKTREELLKIPGIGPYTAGAILSIAFNLKEPLVDGNVMRVYSRFYGYKKPIDLKAAQNFFWIKAAEWVAATKEPRVLNQALMELGATVCTKGSPLCLQCPLQSSCVAYKKNLQALLPIKSKKTEKKLVNWTVYLYQVKDEIFLHQNQKGEWWEGLWDFPRAESKYQDYDLESILTDKNVMRFKKLNRQKHTVTHHQLNVFPCHVRLKKKFKTDLKGQWLSLNALSQLAKSSLVTKIIASLD